MIQGIAELTSLGLSITTIFLCTYVVLLWFGAARGALMSRREMDAQEWFIVGVFFGFVGETLDNLYWAFPWSASFLGLGVAGDLMEFGVYPNIPFRQVLGSVAAYCHIRAHFMFTEAPHKAKHTALLYRGVIAGVVYSVLMVLFYTFM